MEFGVLRGCFIQRRFVSKTPLLKKQQKLRTSLYLGHYQQFVTSTGIPFVPAIPPTIVPVSRKIQFGSPILWGFQRHKNSTFLTIRTNILTCPLSHRPATDSKEQERERKMWRLEIVECELRLRRVENGCAKLTAVTPCSHCRRQPQPSTQGGYADGHRRRSLPVLKCTCL